MSTSISSPQVKTNISQLATTGVTPAQASDGKFTWSVVGESAAGDYLVYACTGLGTPDPTKLGTSGNLLTVGMVSSAKSVTSYIQVSAVYGGSSDRNNWTVQAVSSGNTAQIFKKGNGGGH